MRQGTIGAQHRLDFQRVAQAGVASGTMATRVAATNAAAVPVLAPK
jgi:hypothetical protein